MSEDNLIDDPTKGVAWVNKHIQETEMLIALLKKSVQEGDMDAAKAMSRSEFTLLKWGELLEKYTHQAFQQGKNKTDLGSVSKDRARKVRLNA